MSRGFLFALVGGIAVSGAIWFGLQSVQSTLNEKAGPDRASKILKVRTASLSEDASVAVLDAHLVNDSPRPVAAINVEIRLVKADGSDVTGTAISEQDLARVFARTPLLGEQFNPVLKMLDPVPAHASVDREIAAHFPVPVKELDQRKEIVVSIERHGPPIEMHETRK